MRVDLMHHAPVWVDTESKRNHSPPSELKCLHADVFLVKRGGVQARRCSHTHLLDDELGISDMLKDLPNDGIAIATARASGAPPILDVFQGEAITGLRVYRMLRETGAVLGGCIYHNAGYHWYSDTGNVEVASWTYNPLACSGYDMPREDGVLQAHGRRWHADEGRG